MRGFQGVWRGVGLVVVCVAIWAGPNASAAPAANRDWVGIFPAPSCNSSLAIERLRPKFARDPVPTGDGVFPWPGALGFWVESARGVYVQVSEEKPEGSEYGLVRVSIRSVCDNSTLAIGTKLIRDEDWKEDYMVVALRNYKLSVKKRSRLVAAFEVHNAKDQVCQLNLQMLEVDESGTVLRTDYFRIVRP